MRQDRGRDHCVTTSHGAALARLLLTTALAGAVSTGAALAQTSGAATVELDEVLIRAGDLPPAAPGGQVASGSKLGVLGNKDVMDTPFSTVAYTADYVRNREAQDIGSVIGGTDASVYVPNKRNIQESYSIRGFTSSADDLTFAGLIGMAPNMRGATEMVERVELLKGPSTLLFGMPPGGSVGGAVALMPKRAADAPLTRVTGSYASDGLWGLHADVGRRFGKNKEFGLRFNGLLRDGATAVEGEEHGMKLGSLALDWRGERARVSLDYYRIQEDMDGINYFGLSVGAGVTRLPEPKTGENSLAAPWSFNHNNTETFVLRGEYDITDSLTGFAAFGRRSGGYDALITSSTLLNDAGDISVGGVRSRRDGVQTSGEIGLRGSFATGSISHSWTLSGTVFDSENTFKDRRYNGLTTTNLAAPDFGIAPDLAAYDASGPTSRMNQRLTGITLADSLSFADGRFQLTFGLRHQTVESSTDNLLTGLRSASYKSEKTSPALALVYRPSETLSFYGNYVEGLSAGATAPLSANNAGEVLPPYQTKQIEIGAKWDLGSFTATAALFRIEKPSAYTDPVTNIFGVYGEQRNQGLELSLFGELRPGLRLLGSASYTEAKVTKAQTSAATGKTAAGVPAVMAKLGVEYDVAALPGLTLTGNVSHTGKRYSNNDNTLSVDAFTTLDMGLRYTPEFGAEDLTIRASVQNVTNQAYWAGGSLSGGYGAPRTFLLSVSKDF